MATLTAAQVAALVKKVGFPADSHVTMVAVCRAESGYRVDALNPSSASGLFQILWRVHKQYDQRKLLSDAEYNVRAALDIYRSQGLRAWTAYTNGAYQKYVNEARQAVAQASSITGSPVLPGAAGGTGQQQGVTYGPAGPQIVTAGTGGPLAAAEETGNPLSGLKIIGSELEGDFSASVIGTPRFTAGIGAVPNLVFTVADEEGDLLARAYTVFRYGSRVQYQDLDLRIDQIAFEPGSHGTGQLTMTAIDDIVYALMNLRGSRTAEGISATQWIAQEIGLAGIDPNRWFLGESVPSQSTIARDDADQSGAGGAGERPSAWTTVIRLARELGKHVFISGKRLVFGSAAFAMQWTAEGPLRIGYHIPEQGERWMSLPTASVTSIGNRADVRQITGRVPLNRAKFFRPGVPVGVTQTPTMAGVETKVMMCANVSHAIATDIDGADITLIEPVDPPPQPPAAPTVAGANGGSTSAGTSVSGGGADGQIASFVSLALQQAGKRYVFGAEAAASDPNPRAFDCSELVEWAAARTGIPKVPDGSAAQLAHTRKAPAITVGQAIGTKGALLFMPGHVAISLGNGKTIEAMNPSNGVRQGNATGRAWTAGGLIPGAKGYNVAPRPAGNVRVQ